MIELHKSDATLNKLSAEGWEVVAMAVQFTNSFFTLKRYKK